MQQLSRKLLKHNIEKIAEYDLLQHKVFGSAYCVLQENESVYKQYFGYTSADGKKAVDEATLFRLASMTKPITAMAILILVERGLLTLSDTVWKYLPAFKDIHVIHWTGSQIIMDQGKAKNDVTIRHLLTHTSGFGSEESKVLCMTTKHKSTIDNSIQYFLKVGLDFEPGTRQQYSGTAAFDVLAKVIETITGIEYQKFLKKEIFDPCGMKNTTEQDWYLLCLTMRSLFECC